MPWYFWNLLLSSVTYLAESVVYARRSMGFVTRGGTEGHIATSTRARNCLPTFVYEPLVCVLEPTGPRGFMFQNIRCMTSQTLGETVLGSTSLNFLIWQHIIYNPHFHQLTVPVWTVEHCFFDTFSVSYGPHSGKNKYPSRTQPVPRVPW